MHLDPMELILLLEERFGITIPDSDAEQITNFGELHSYILYKKGMRHLDFCPSSRVFYRLRQALMTELAIGRQRIRRASHVEALVPRAGRRRHWTQLGSALGEWRMPQLERPVWALVMLAFPIIGMLLSFGSMVAFAGAKQQSAIAALALVGSAYLLLLLHWLTGRFAVELPGECSTVDGLTSVLLKWNFARLLPEAGPVPCDETWEKLCGIFHTWSGVDPGKLTPELRFTDYFDDLESRGKK